MSGQRTHEENRANMALRIVATVAMVALKRGIDPRELLLAADVRDWHLFARLAGGAADYTPALETRDLVKAAFRDAAEILRLAEAA